MLSQTPRPFSKLSVTGQIDMRTVFGMAHRMAKVDADEQKIVHANHAAKGTTPRKPLRSYRVIFAARLRELLADARQQKSQFTEGLCLVSRELSFGGFREVVTTIERF